MAPVGLVGFAKSLNDDWMGLGGFALYCLCQGRSKRIGPEYTYNQGRHGIGKCRVRPGYKTGKIIQKGRFDLVFWGALGMGFRRSGNADTQCENDVEYFEQK